MSAIDAYLEYVREAVRGLPAPHAESLRDELISHIDEKRKAYEASGVSDDDAIRMALEAMGPASDVRHGLTQVHGGTSWVEIRWRKLWLPALVGLIVATVVWASEWAAYWVVVLPELKAVLQRQQEMPNWPTAVPQRARELTDPWVFCSLAVAAVGLAFWCYRRRHGFIETLLMFLPALVVAAAQQICGFLFLLVWFVPQDEQLIGIVPDYTPRLLTYEVWRLLEIATFLLIFLGAVAAARLLYRTVHWLAHRSGMPSARLPVPRSAN